MPRTGGDYNNVGGDFNSGGDYNVGDYNNGGDYNGGDYNSGGDYNVGDYNNGGDYTGGDYNNVGGDFNVGDYNSGDYNNGGDYNRLDYNNGGDYNNCEAAKSGNSESEEEGVVDGVAPVAIGGGVVDGVALVAICPCEAAKSGRIFTSISSGGIEYYVFSRVVGDCAFSSCQACPGLVLLWHGDDLQQVFMRDQFLLVLRG